MDNFWESGGGWILAVAVFAVAWLVSSVVNFFSGRDRTKLKEYDELKGRLDNLDAYSKRLEAYKIQLENYFKNEREIIEFLAKEKAMGFPWLAKAYADYFHLQDLKRADYLTDKSHPALSAAEHLRQVAEARRKAEELSRVLAYKMEFYESLELPEKLLARLASFKGEDLDDLLTRIDVQANAQAIEILAKQKSEGFPWLAQAYADYLHLQDLQKARFLEVKSPPAIVAAEQVREIASRRRTAEQLYRVREYQLKYYESLFPWLVDFKGEDIDDLIIQIVEKSERGSEDLEEPDDPVKKWVSPAEYQNLPTVERNQRALDRYWQKKKSKWEIGRDYERYIGYLYEKSGFSVYYQGIIAGFEDLGRDLIAVQRDNTEIVQCKRWSQERTIHEKHVFQLFGTSIEYWLKNTDNKKPFQPSLFPELLRQEKIKPVLITSTTLSEKAKEFATVLHVQVLENFPLQHYPSIKCNVSRRTGEKIYHLPFDQQYDRVLIEEERNECYVETVAEAERLGFRRAFRWRGETSQ